MKFCKTCERVMIRDLSGEKVEFICTICGDKEFGDEWDSRIFGEVFHEGETLEKYEVFISNAANDRVNQLVEKRCVQCGLDYMTQIRLGNKEMVIWKCKCGHQEEPK